MRGAAIAGGRASGVIPVVFNMLDNGQLNVQPALI
jgi:hypothetical protein